MFVLGSNAYTHGNQSQILLYTRQRVHAASSTRRVHLVHPLVYKVHVGRIFRQVHM